MQDKENKKLNVLAYYISQFFWIIYILIPLLLAIAFPKKTKRITVHSSLTKYNKSIDPVIFAHVSDIHINSLQPSSIKSFRETFNTIKQILPEFVVITGDIVDNYDSISIPRYGEQNEENWRIYKEGTSNFTNIPIIEVGGNHDMFGIKDIYSHKNYFLSSSNSFNRNNTKCNDDFLIHSFNVGPSKTNIIAINPFDFPTSHPPLLLYKYFSFNILNLLDNEISKSKTKNIVICHYPVGSIHSKKSSNGKSFLNIMSSESVLVFLSGHSHPKNPEFFHHGNGNLEVLGVSSFQQSKFGLVSIDNDGINWSPIDIRNPQNGVITYPIPKRQLSSNSIFNDKENSEIRVVIFSDEKNLSINFKITDLTNKNTSYSGKLIYSRKIINGHSLYTFPLNKCIKKNGYYNITFTGDFNGFMDFVINDNVETGNEKLTEYPRIVDMLNFTFIIFILILITITIVIPFNCFDCSVKLNNIEELIETNNLKEGNIISNWIMVTFGSFLVIRTRFQKTPIILKCFVFISVLYSLFGPIMFFKTENLFGYVWLYGYFIDNQVFHSDYGVFYSYFYLGIVCTPMILICSSFGVKKWSKLQIGDIFFSILALISDIIILIRIIHQTVGPKLIALNIGFVFIPIVFILLLFIVFFIRKNNNNIENEGIVDIDES